MKRGFINPSVRKKAGLRRNAFIFIVCIVISASIWALIKLSKEYAVVFPYNVVYKGIPDGKQITNYPDSVFNLNIKQKGFKVLLQKLSLKDHTIEIDLTNRLHPYLHEKKSFYLLTSELVSQINYQLSAASNVISISPDTVRFSFDKSISKKIAVKPLIDLSCEKQYLLSGEIKIVPESIMINGPFKFLDTLKSISTDLKKLSHLNKSEIVSLSFTKWCKQFRCTTDPEYIKAFIPVDKYTESTIEIPVIVKNCPAKYSIKTLPEKIKITYLVGLSDFKRVKPEMFSVIADYSKAKDLMLKIEISEKPDFVKINKIFPESVEFILF